MWVICQNKKFCRLLITRLHTVTGATADLHNESIGQKKQYKPKLLEGKRKTGEIGRRPTKKDVCRMKAGRKNEYAECVALFDYLPPILPKTYPNLLIASSSIKGQFKVYFMALNTLILETSVH